MKKFLLFAAMSAIMAMGASADTDGQQYDAINGINIANQWILDRIHSGDGFASLDVCNTRARTAVMAGDIIYVARSEAKAVVVGNDTISQSVIYRFKVEDGTQLEPLDVTLGGQPYGVFLGVNSIGVDNFGHVWVAPYTSEGESSTSVPFYSLNTETGELTLLARFDKEVIQRTDYYDVMGDITLENAGCTVMSAAANSATVYRWYVPQGASYDDYEGGFEGDTYLDIIDFYPETVTEWGTAPVVKMVYDPDADDPYAGELFYVDGFTAAPALYDVTGSLIDSFDGADPDLMPYEVGANGVAEFTLDGRSFFVYAQAQYSGHDDKNNIDRFCQANICELGEGMTIAGMEKYWTVPANGLGETSDGGNRVHCLNVAYGEEGGEPCVILFDYKCYNGMAVYKIGKGVTPHQGDDFKKGDVDGNGEVDVNDINILINIMLGKDSDSKYNGRANVDGEGAIDVADVNAIINAMLGK